MKALDRPALTWVIAGAYVLVGSWFLFGRLAVHDEGLSTYFFARYVGDDFVAAVFCQKFKPVVAAFYAPVARLGLRPFLFVHVIVGAAGVLLAARAARALGSGASNVAAVVVAFSPIYLLGGPLGLSNVDGVVALCLVLVLYARDPDSPGWAIVLGMLPWIRYELSPFVVVLLVWEVLTRHRWIALVQGAAFPAVYLVAGAVYHRDLLWAVHFQPSAAPQSSNPLWAAVGGQGSLGQFAVRLALVAPFGVAALLAPWKRLRAAERASAVFAGVYLLALNVLPRFRIVNFDYSPRYSLEVLPVLALLVARASNRWPRLSSLSAGGTAAALAALAVASIAPTWGALQRYGYGPSPSLEGASAWLREHAEVSSGRRVYTDMSCLPSYLAMRGGGSLDVRYLEGQDQAYEIGALTDGANGQREAVQRLVARTFYGKPELLADTRAVDVPTGSLFVLSHDLRLPGRLSEDIRRHLRPLASSDAFSVDSLEDGEQPGMIPEDDERRADEPPPADVTALLGGLVAGDVLGSWTVVRVGTPSEHRVRVEVRRDAITLPLFLARRDETPPNPPHTTGRYGVFYGTPSQPGQHVETDQVDDALAALAARIEQNEEHVPLPAGL